MMMGKNDELPFAILDSDKMGESAANSLRTGLYSSQSRRLIRLSAIVGFSGAETEDLIPSRELEAALARYARAQTDDDTIFENKLSNRDPIVGQIESIAQSNGIELALGWKVTLADYVKARVEQRADVIDAPTLDRWTTLFAAIEAVN